MFTPRPAALAACSALIGILFIAACASRQPPRGAPQGGPPGGTMPDRQGSRFEGGLITRPVALLFTGMDRNQDYAVDQAELADGIAREWDALPRTGRASVPSIAMTDWATQALGDTEALPNPIAFDVNLDGQISEQEFRSRLFEEYAQLDKDRNGRLTRAEMLVLMPVRTQSRGGPQGGQPPGGRGGPPPR